MICAGFFNLRLAAQKSFRFPFCAPYEQKALPSISAISELLPYYSKHNLVRLHGSPDFDQV
jgi:hypothetical protein